MKILVVEDSKTQAESLRYILEKMGHVVALAANGREALEQITIDRPGLVLTDIMMPEMDGYELCRRIKQDQNIKTLPVIIVTQLFDPVDVVKGLEAGADNFIIKPYEPGDINSRINDVMKALGIPDYQEPYRELQLDLPDRVHTITANRRQILNILLSTYDITVRKNAELQEAHERLNLLNDQLHQAILDLKCANEDLHHENTERTRAEKALFEANKKLELMANITRHDLLNQLTALREYLDLAQILSQKDIKKAFEHIASAGTIVNQTINTVTFTGEYQKIGVKSPVWQNVPALVNNAVNQTSIGSVVLKNLVCDECEIFADLLIEKVFSNLIGNAVRYGGKITTISIKYEEQGAVKKIICEDDGAGIADDEKEKIFTYEYGMNTGLGLFLAKEILAITGITIKETGILGKGARFELICPAETIRMIPKISR
jgi:DNA-binding response OmpR family regulator